MAQFQVTIRFTDGTYSNQVFASSSTRAYELALIDARLASKYGTFYGSVVGWDSVEVAQ